MAQRHIHGVRNNQEVPPTTEFRDIRTKTEKFRAFVETPNSPYFIGAMILGTMFIFPKFIEFFFIVGVILLRWISKQEISVPFRMPEIGGGTDPSDPHPVTNMPKPSKGISFLGNDIATKKELWFQADDLKTHLLVFGSTGAGKPLRNTETILTLQGWIPLNKLYEGQIIFTIDGGLQRVEGIYPQGKKKLLSLTLDDGRSLVSSTDHFWEVVDKEGNVEVITTQQVLETLADKKWMMPIPSAVPLPESKQNMKNYILDLKTRLTIGEHLPKTLNGSLEQRTELLGLIENSFHTQYLKESTVIKVPSIAGAMWIADLARGLGHWAKPSTLEENGKWTVEIKKEFNKVNVATVTDLGFEEDCTCIEVSDPRGLFIASNYVATHNTETLISYAFNSLVHGSGFIYVDGKGDNSLFAKIYSLCRSVGREDDLLCINYMTGGRDVFGAQENKLSNTLNPFSRGSAAGLTELLVGLMDDAGGEGGMWKGRAITLISGIMFVLVYMRDNEGFLLDVDEIRNYMILENIQKLAERKEIPPALLKSIRAYLRSLPGYVEGADQQSDTVKDQHGYLQMQFTRILGSLSDTYGYIFRTNLGEVDLEDIVINRRILVVLLPALEKSQDELGNLGKIIVSVLKQMMAVGLGDKLEGEFEQTVQNKPTNAASPFVCILDEYGYYVVKGAAVMPAQARSLGFSMVFAGQDYPAMKKNNNAEEAVSTIGNCNIKVFMKVEDPTDTFELFKQSVGEAIVSKTSGFTFETGAFDQSYMDQKNVSLDRRNRGDLRDLKNQKPGEGHIIFKDILIRAQMFYAQPDDPIDIYLNHFLRVAPPKLNHMQNLDNKINKMIDCLSDINLINDFAQSNKVNQRLNTAIMACNQLMEKGEPIEDAMISSALAAFQMSFRILKESSEEVTRKAAYNSANHMTAFGMNTNDNDDEEEDEDEEDVEDKDVYESEEENEEEEEEEEEEENDDDSEDDEENREEQRNRFLRRRRQEHDSEKERERDRQLRRRMSSISQNGENEEDNEEDDEEENQVPFGDSRNQKTNDTLNMLKQYQNKKEEEPNSPEQSSFLDVPSEETYRSKDDSFLSKANTRQKLEELLLASDSTEKEAKKISRDYVDQIIHTTTYPSPENQIEPAKPDEIIGIIQELDE